MFKYSIIHSPFPRTVHILKNMSMDFTWIDLLKYVDNS